MKPFLLGAVCKDYIWGGNRLRGFGKVSEADRIAESWELSTHPDGESIITTGTSRGMKLGTFLKAHPETMALTGTPFDPFPVIVKLIDAHEDLSVQVHPDKTELWYVIDAEPGASVLYGFAHEITPEDYVNAIREEKLLSLMKQIPVKAGDVFLIPKGTLHSIGKGLLLAEIQQNSNITYRVYDHHRDRELHIAQALPVTNLKPVTNPPPHPTVPFSPENGDTIQILGGCRYFTSCISSITSHREAKSSFSYEHLLVLDGYANLSTEEGSLQIQKGNSVFIPAGTAYDLWGECRLLSTTTVPNGC